MAIGSEGIVTSVISEQSVLYQVVQGFFQLGISEAESRICPPECRQQC